MTYFAQNLRHLRKRSAKTQEQLGRAIQLGRTTIANYESGLSTPTDPEVLVRLARMFSVSIDELLTRDLSDAFRPTAPAAVQPTAGAVLSTTAPRSETRVAFVAREEGVHYGALSADPAYLASLPVYTFPGLPSGEYRVFELTDAALAPRFAPGDRALCRRVETPSELQDGTPCLLLSTAHGPLLRRVLLRPGGLLRLLCDSGVSTPAEVEWGNLQELWQVEWLLSARLEPAMSQVYGKIADLEQQLLAFTNQLPKP